MEEALKLHLGCGEVYLDGYRNIDYPPSEHTVQTQTKVDEYADILRELVYPRASIEEVRLHHVFEHFTHPGATGSFREGLEETLTVIRLGAA